MHIPFNKPYLAGSELELIRTAVLSQHISGDGPFTRQCQTFFQNRYRFLRALFTTSCTDALEMSGILLDLKPGDEIILPSYTFVSCANAFQLRGGTLRFADSTPETPNIDPKNIQELITERTKAIVVVHYAGIACEMDEILRLARSNNIPIIEDSAHAIESYYLSKRDGGSSKSFSLGTLGSLATFSFHETKNISCGEGGLLAINDPSFIERAEILWHKGTNRSQFSKKKVDKYSWVDIGSSFLGSDMLAAYLWAQLQNLEEIQTKRIRAWERYYTELRILEESGVAKLPIIPDYATVNGHIFYLLTNDLKERDELLKFLNERGVNAVFHYVTLHDSPYFKDRYRGPALSNASRFSETLVRLPLFCDITEEEQDTVIRLTKEFYGLNSQVRVLA